VGIAHPNNHISAEDDRQKSRKNHIKCPESADLLMRFTPLKRYNQNKHPRLHLP